MTEDKPPTNMEEAIARAARNVEIFGYGINEVAVSIPCPWCAAKDWMTYKIVDLAFRPHEALGKRTCAECGRTGMALYNDTGSTVTTEYVQTGGPDPEPWQTTAPRRVYED